MARSIALDNSVLSPLIKSVVDPSKLESEKDKVNARRAREFIESIQSGNAGTVAKEDQLKITIPMPALTECLAGWLPKDQGGTLLRLKKIGTPLFFDESAAILAGQMWAEMKAKGQLKAERGLGRPRDCVKFDVMIAACCKAHGVGTLYYEDHNFTAISQLEACRGLFFSTLPLGTGTRKMDFEKTNDQAKKEKPPEKK